MPMQENYYVKKDLSVSAALPTPLESHQAAEKVAGESFEDEKLLSDASARMQAIVNGIEYPSQLEDKVEQFFSSRPLSLRRMRMILPLAKAFPIKTPLHAYEVPEGERIKKHEQYRIDDALPGNEWTGIYSLWIKDYNPKAVGKKFNEGLEPWGPRVKIVVEKGQPKAIALYWTGKMGFGSYSRTTYEPLEGSVNEDIRKKVDAEGLFQSQYVPSVYWNGHKAIVIPLDFLSDSHSRPSIIFVANEYDFDPTYVLAKRDKKAKDISMQEYFLTQDAGEEGFLLPKREHIGDIDRSGREFILKHTFVQLLHELTSYLPVDPVQI